MNFDKVKVEKATAIIKKLLNGVVVGIGVFACLLGYMLLTGEGVTIHDLSWLVIASMSVPLLNRTLSGSFAIWN